MTKIHASTIQEANIVLLVDGNLEAAEEYFTPDYQVHIADHGMKGGCDIVKDNISSLRNSFSNIQVEVDILVESDTRVAWQRTLHATHSGAFKGFPASGLQIVWRDMVTSEFRGDLIAEEWVLTDLAERLLLSRKRKPTAKQE